MPCILALLVHAIFMVHCAAAVRFFPKLQWFDFSVFSVCVLSRLFFWFFFVCAIDDIINDFTSMFLCCLFQICCCSCVAVVVINFNYKALPVTL